VGGILARQPWSGIEGLIPSGPRELAARQVRIRRFVELLLQWNRRVSNLISKNDESRIVAAHLAPSLEPAEWIASHGLAKWIDFGSGGGFPALPLALCGIGERWDLVESRRTKTLFLRRAVEQLELRGVTVITDRLERLVGASPPARAEEAIVPDAEWVETEADADELYGAGAPNGESGGAARQSRSESSESISPPYDGFTSRATMALAPTLELAARIVRPGGIAFLWKGSRLDGEIAASPSMGKDWEIVERRKLSNDMTEVLKLLRKA
jgi:16S rRNA G527 N7-methylase RsmG